MKRAILFIIILLTFNFVNQTDAETVAKIPTYLAGGDISLLTHEEQLGTVYKLNGKHTDFLTIAKKSGWNTMRLRLWVNPSHQDIYVNDLAYTEALGRRIKKAGFTLILDIHYSDSWADPGKQFKPAAWSDLDFQDLTKQVHAYTESVIAGMINSGAAPDIVQIGNEIPGGMLFPDGKDWGPGNDFKKLGLLLKSGIQGVKDGSVGHSRPQIMIHIDRGADWGGTKWFFEGVNAQGVQYDLIGESYYPAYHGPMSALKECLKNAGAEFHKPVIVVETGYPYSGDPNLQKTPGKGALEYPVTKEGQVSFLRDLTDVVKSAPGGFGRGVIYWAPEWIPAKGMQGSWDTKTLFDDSGNALPAISELKGAQ
jgi:arabinogalactan endo-1,4-beta-galactosidase